MLLNSLSLYDNATDDIHGVPQSEGAAGMMHSTELSPVIIPKTGSPAPIELEKKQYTDAPFYNVSVVILTLDPPIANEDEGVILVGTRSPCTLKLNVFEAIPPLVTIFTLCCPIGNTGTEQRNALRFNLSTGIIILPTEHTDTSSPKKAPLISMLPPPVVDTTVGVIDAMAGTELNVNDTGTEVMQLVMHPVHYLQHQFVQKSHYEQWVQLCRLLVY